MLKFLVDECLSPTLVDIAVEFDHVESTCVRNRGWAGKPDHQILELALSDDFTLVTHNARDFRGVGEQHPGGLYARLELHAGLVCLTAEDINLEVQQELFRAALTELQSIQDLINRCLEIELIDDKLRITLYDIGGEA